MRWIAHALAASAIAITLLVSAIGPQAFVMQQNIARALDPTLVPAGGHSGFDLDYGLTLGDDSVPTLVAAIDRLPPADRSNALAQLWARRHDVELDPTTTSVFAWNLSRERARDALANLPSR
jgi:hypothetical protein